jgi:hypothetical protein
MRPVPHTLKKAIRFQLLTKTAHQPWAQVRSGDLGTWLNPVQPGLGQRPGDVWAISHPITDLPAPAVYRFRVTFRWIGVHARVLAVRTLLSQKCTQPELRPDLRAQSITTAPIQGKPNLDRYTVAVRNGGATAAGAFEVLFSPPAASGVQPRSKTVVGLAPHQGVQVSFTGPACTAATAPTVTVDPSQRVPDANRANNSLTVPAACPGTTT